MYWLPKIHNTPIAARFTSITEYCFENYSTKPLSDTTSKIFKMIFNTVESVHKKSLFLEDVKNSGLCKILF